LSEEALPRALAIVGPTASGKSRLAVWLAERLELPVLCCDSVQVYRGLDIGSAKPGPELQARVPHRLIDLVDPDQEFSAGDYAAAAHAELARGPGLFCGGTGFYLRAAGWTHSGGEPEGEAVEADGSARAAFTALWEGRERESAGVVHAALSRVDPETARAIHPRNVVRALRALWLCEAHAQPVSRVREADPPRPRLALGLVMLEPEPAALARAIDTRCDAMLRSGFLAEVEMLRRAGYDARHKSMRSLGYRQLLDHLDGHLSLADAVAAIKAMTRAYARRQRTFFRHQLGTAALRVAVTTPLWAPEVDLSRETGAWLPRVLAFLSGAHS
jgi:tRNA dimethylallyltransferase